MKKESKNKKLSRLLRRKIRNMHQEDNALDGRFRTKIFEDKKKKQKDEKYTYEND